MNPVKIEGVEDKLLIFRAVDTGRQYYVHIDEVIAVMPKLDEVIAAMPKLPELPITPNDIKPYSGMPAPNAPGTPDGPDIDPETPHHAPDGEHRET